MISSFWRRTVRTAGPLSLLKISTPSLYVPSLTPSTSCSVSPGSIPASCHAQTEDTRTQKSAQAEAGRTDAHVGRGLTYVRKYRETKKNYSVHFSSVKHTLIYLSEANQSGFTTKAAIRGVGVTQCKAGDASFQHRSCNRHDKNKERVEQSSLLLPCPCSTKAIHPFTLHLRADASVGIFTIQTPFKLVHLREKAKWAEHPLHSLPFLPSDTHQNEATRTLTSAGFGVRSGMGRKPFTTQRLPSFSFPRIRPSPLGPTVAVTFSWWVLTFFVSDGRTTSSSNSKRYMCTIIKGVSL